jgi:hypothetical protein
MTCNKLRWLLIGVGLFGLISAANAQSLTGQITGTVVDSGGALMPGADVQLTNDLSKQVRAFTTGQNGNFAFPDLVAGNYSIHVTKEGFKAYDSKGIRLASSESLDLHELKLEIGDVSTSISVESNAARVQTDSSDRFSTIESSAIENVPNPTRSFLSATRAIPGAQSTGSTGAGNINGGGAFGGGPSGTSNVVLQLDGVVQQDSGAPSSGVSSGRFLVNNDAVNEVQVQTNVMNAEYGSRAGGQVTISTKNGTSQFHGGVYFYLRNEDFNANTFFNNRNSVVRPKSRFQNPGFTFGGPVLLPKVPFNRGRNKMYFFYAEDQVYNKTQGSNNFTMPTDLEKAGNFSQTVTTQGVLIPVKDPTTGLQFTGNIIPSNRIDPEGLAMLNLFPSGCPWTGGTPGALGKANSFGVALKCIIDPTTTATTGHGYNTQTFPVTSLPTTTRTLRVDYNFAAKTNMYVRLLQSLNTAKGGNTGQAGGGSAWGQFDNTNPQNGRGYVMSMVHTFSPTLVADFTMGTNFVHQQNQPLDPTAFFNSSDLSTFKYANGQLVNPTQIFAGNYLNLIPNITFSGGSATTGNAPQTAGPSNQNYVSGAPSYGFDTRWPFDGTELTSNYSTNWTRIKGSHTLKAGFNLEHGARNVSVFENFSINGSYYFGTDTANPLDTGNSISNMLLGSIQSYGQDNVKQINHARYYQYEWFLQDTWKATRRLTLDYGMRFQIIPPTYSAGAVLGLFDSNSFSSAKTGTLLFPTCIVPLSPTGTCPGPVTNTQAINPKTGKLYPGVDIGKFDPLSFANNNPYSGIVTFNNGHVFQTQHPQYGPRVGFAYDVYGDGKMAVRGGFGIFYNRAYPVDPIAASGGLSGPIKIPPQFQSPAFFDTTFAGLATAQPFLGPQAFNGGTINMPNPTTYNWSLSVQKDIGKGMVLEVGYVGNVLHHGQSSSSVNANPIMPDTVWSPTGGTCNAVGNCSGTLNPAFVSPVNPAQILPINLVRSLVGYNGISDVNVFTSSGESNYNALQTQLNKRFGKSVQFSSNWTWQKTQAFNRNQYLPDQLIKTVSGRKQAVNITVNYAVPSLTSLVGKNFMTNAVFDGWHVDGVMAFFSGNPVGASCSVSGGPAGYPNGQDGIGGAIPFRCDLKGNVFLPDGSMPSVANGNAANTDPRLWYPVNAASFVLPALSTNGFGNAPPTLFWGPGFENVDISVYKSFKIVKETNQLQLRADITNVLNHFNPGDPNTTFTINYANNANTNASFGQITSQTGAARVMALSLRFRF